MSQQVVYISPDVKLQWAAMRLADLYCEELNVSQLPYMKRWFSRWLEDGYEESLLAEAVRRTAEAPRPAWAYLKAIVYN